MTCYLPRHSKTTAQTGTTSEPLGNKLWRGSWLHRFSSSAHSQGCRYQNRKCLWDPDSFPLDRLRPTQMTWAVIPTLQCFQLDRVPPAFQFRGSTPASAHRTARPLSTACYLPKSFLMSRGLRITQSRSHSYTIWAPR